MSDERSTGGERRGSNRGGAGGRTSGGRAPRRDSPREPKQVRVSPARIVAYEVLPSTGSCWFSTCKR